MTFKPKHGWGPNDPSIPAFIQSLKREALKELYPDFETFYEWVNKVWQLLRGRKELGPAHEYLPSALGFKVRDKPLTWREFSDIVLLERHKLYNDPELGLRRPKLMFGFEDGLAGVKPADDYEYPPVCLALGKQNPGKPMLGYNPAFSDVED